MPHRQTLSPGRLDQRDLAHTTLRNVRYLGVNANDPKRTLGRRHLVRLGPRMHWVMPTYAAFLNAVVSSSCQSIIAAGSIGEKVGEAFRHWWARLLIQGLDFGRSPAATTCTTL